MFTVLIIGDVMLDHYILGDCSRISPEAPVPVVNIQEEEWRLGGAANVANNLAALQTKCTLLGLCGNDGNAVALDAILQKTNLINNQVCRSNSRPTIVKSRILVGSHQLIRLDRENTAPASEVEENALLETFYQQVLHTDLVLVSDYRKGVVSPHLLQTVFATAKQLSIKTIVDPKSADFSLYKGAHFIKPNRHEAEQATGIRITDRSSLEQAARKIKQITEAEAVIITLSEDGVALLTEHGLQIIPTKAKKVFDVTGAGDTFLSAFTYEYLHSSDVFAACEFANAAAAVVISKVGSSTASLDEINEIRKEVPAYEPAID